jgi:hypothetical protein
MGLFIDHVNSVLQKMRQPLITSLSTDTTTEAYRAQEAVKRAVLRVWNYKQWSFKLRRYTFPTTSGTSDYVLPRLMRETYKIMSSDSPYDITTVSEDSFDKQVPNPQSSGNPYIARLFEMVGVQTQPTSTGSVRITSSSGSDTTQKVLVKGLVGGQLDYEQLSINGTANNDSTKQFSAIYSVTKSDVTSGYVTVSSDGGTITNVILSPLEKSVRLRVIRLFPTPSSTITITVKGFGRPVGLTHAYEDTEIPNDWDYVVDQWGFALALQSRGQDQIQEFTSELALAVKMLEEDMITEEFISAEELIIPERWGGEGAERLGWTSLPDGYGITSVY